MPSYKYHPRPILFRDYSRRSQLRIVRELKKLRENRIFESRSVGVQHVNQREDPNFENGATDRGSNDLDDTEYDLLQDEASLNTLNIEEDLREIDSDDETSEENSMHYDPWSEDEEEEWFTGDEGDEEEEDISGSENGHDQDSQNSETQEEDSPLYPGARITVGESLLAVLTLSLRHSFTGACLADILNLVELHCMEPNNCKKSLYLFRKYFETIYTPLTRRYYCASCFSPLETIDTLCENCLEATKVAYFIEIPLIHQLQTLYRRSDFLQQLQYKFTRTKQNDDFYEDIYDGNVYQELCQPGEILSNPNNISFMWNTDGVSIFKSSKYSIWPFFLSINELPYDQRTRKENLLLGGLWFGPSKPYPPLFLQSISKEMSTLRNGVDFEVSGRDDPVRVQAIVICGTCDAPAKALFLNMKQYNGECGCQKCLTQSVRYGKSNVRIYPFEMTLIDRTQEETDRLAAEAAEFGTAPKGVKGPSAIAGLVIDYIRTTAIDAMHLVFLGLIQILLILWFSPKFRDKPWSLYKFKHIVDQKICAMTPPTFVARLPRSIIANLNYLKASELKTWFFYYSLPILESIMPPIYLKHYQLLVNAIYLFSRNSISEEMVNLGDQYIIEFILRFSDLYDARYMCSNLHGARHLAQTVRDFGPLWVTSCFAFENVNGQLKTLVRGTRFAGLQICTGLSYFMALPELIEKLEPMSPIREFCDRLSKPERKFKSHKISSQLHIVGTIKTRMNLPERITEALESSNFIGSNLGIFYRLIKKKTLYMSTMYRRCTKTNSTCAKYNVDGEVNFGIINCFVRVSNCTCRSHCSSIDCNPQYCAIMQKCITRPRFNSNLNGNDTFNVNLSGIYECAVSDDVIAVTVDKLSCICFFLKISNESYYIAEPANSMEVE